jgi:Zn-dependent peptidase ImmA (M78 family)
MSNVLPFKRDPRISEEHRGHLRAFSSQLGQEIVELACDLGLKVFEENLASDCSGFLKHAPELGSASGYVVVVRADDPPTRKRFTVAHEIGHFVLHTRRPHTHEKMRYESPTDYFLDDPEALRQEGEANRFARELLMPRHILKAERIHCPHQLAARCRVSVAAAEVRLSEIGREASAA